jgi:hypothetical protein
MTNYMLQSHCSIGTPDDATAVFEWSVDAPFVSQDKPPLAISMVAYVNHTKALRRYRLVLLDRNKLKLAGKVADAFNPSSKHHTLTKSRLFPSPHTMDIVYGYATDSYQSPLWLCVPRWGGRAGPS